MRPTRFAAFLAVVLLAPAAGADDVTTTAGKKVSGKLVGVDAQGITFSSGEVKVPIPARDIVLVDFGNKPVAPPKDATYSEVELTDGSTLRVAKYALKGKKLATELLPGGPAGVAAPVYELPMGSVFVAMKRADDPKVREGWKKLLASRGKRDLYVMQQEAGLTYQVGTVLEGSEDGATISFDGGDGKRTELKQSRAAGLVFHQPQLAVAPPTVCRVVDVYGNVLTAAAVAVSPEGVAVTTVSGATVKYASTAALVRFDYEQGNLAYLSDLNPKVDAPADPPEEARLEPLPAVPVLKDTALANTPIKVDGVTYAKGLCVLPDTALTFTLNGDYTSFRATAGIDENGAIANAAARLIIEADGQVVFNEVLRRKDKPKGVTFSVKGVKQLRLIVEVDTAYTGNYVALAEARVQK